MTDELMALADRVEALAEPCRETDAAIYLALHLPNWRDGDPWKKTNGWFKKNCAEDAIAYFFHDGMGGRSVTVKSFTASLDAAMTLVPADMVWNAGNDVRCWAHIWRDKKLYNGVPWDSRAATPALALTAAALRARASKEPEA